VPFLTPGANRRPKVKPRCASVRVIRNQSERELMDMSIGYLSFALALTAPLVYLAGRQSRRLGAYIMSDETQRPKERVGFFVPAFIVSGFVLGSFVQPLWDRGQECKVRGEAVFVCVFLKAGTRGNDK